jgi:DNA adenine methylase
LDADMNEITRPVLRYHGGKFGIRGRTAALIISHFPEHRVYVEPFGGAASVLLCKPRAYGEVYNDLWSGVVRVFRVLRDSVQAAELERLLRLTPFARDEIKLTDHPFMQDLTDLEFARRLIFRSFAGFGSGAANPKYSTGFRANSNRSGTTPAQDWANYPEHIVRFCERMRGVTIENNDASTVMLAHDTPDTLHFIDPPYVHSARSQKRRREREYEHEMLDDDHRALAATVHGLAGMAILCGYHSPLYDELYADWKRIEFDSFADGAAPRKEVLWFNDAAWARRPKPQPVQQVML